MIEALIASAILVTTLAGITSMWYVSFNMTNSSDAIGVAYMIGRRQFEYVKQNGYQTGGFQLAADGTSTAYFDDAGNVISGTPSSYIYSAVTVMATTNGLQTVTVTVTSASSNTPLYQSSTYLVKAGI